MPRHLATGEFGLWRETGQLNDFVAAAVRTDLGLGAAVGQAILDRCLPFADLSVLAAARLLGMPVTVHVGIGQDIVHQHPNCDGAVRGEARYRDLLTLAWQVERLEGGVVVNLGFAVMGPEVFRKALAMARNANGGAGAIRRFTTVGTDLHPFPSRPAREPRRDAPACFFRPWKTLLVRAVAEGGNARYMQIAHSDLLPQLWTARSATPRARPGANGGGSTVARRSARLRHDGDEVRRRRSGLPDRVP